MSTTLHNDTNAGVWLVCDDAGQPISVLRPFRTNGKDIVSPVAFATIEAATWFIRSDWRTGLQARQSTVAEYRQLLANLNPGTDTAKVAL